MNDERDALWTRFLDGDPLSPEEAGRLHEALAADEGFRRARLRDRQLDGVLRGLTLSREGGEAFVRELFGRVAAEGSSEPFVARMDARLRAELAPRARWTRLAAALTAGALLGAAAVAAIVVRPQRPAPERQADPVFVAPAAAPAGPAAGPRSLPVAVLTAPREATFVVSDGRRSAARAGEPLPAGAAVLTVGPGSGAELAFADGTRLELGGDAILASLGAAGGKRALLARGTLRAAVRPQPAGEPMVVSTPHADAVVVGTRFALEVSERETRLQVDEGRVRLRRTVGGGEEALVAAGQTAVASERVAPAAALAAPGGTVLFVVGRLPLLAGDEAVRRRLVALGHDVRLRAPGLLRESDLQGNVLVALSSTIDSADLNLSLRDLPVPVLCWEPMLFDDLGMVVSEEDVEHGKLQWGSELVVKDTLHPLAGGLAGPQHVTTEPTDLTWATPGALATWVATVPGRPTRAGVFAYERGAPLAGGGIAPARRTGFFFYDWTAPRLTPAGWALFDAAVKWTAERPAAR